MPQYIRREREATCKSADTQRKGGVVARLLAPGREEAEPRVLGDERSVYAARARRLGLPFTTRFVLAPQAGASINADAVRRGTIAAFAGGERHAFVAPDEEMMPEIRHWLGRFRSARPHLVITTPSAIRRALMRAGAHHFLRGAISHLSNRYPHLSARWTATTGQIVFGTFLLAGTVAALHAAPGDTLMALNFAASLFFLGVTLLRFIAAAIVADRRPRDRPEATETPEENLPVYTVLVPLYREAHMVRQLVAALDRLDWPRERLDIKLIVEADDRPTRHAAEALAMAPPYEVVEVPAAAPRTKPKALTFALQFARGNFVVVYDAEDRPHPGQLREAFAAFSNGPPELACLQSPIAIDNGGASMLSRLFALEYSTLFDGLLPALAHLDLPLPLGGTSNHFRRAALEAIGGWDPFNVTEDADVGLRLARFGYRARTLDLQTFEEAPTVMISWLRQRTRWFKGWLQTWLVHSRRPLMLLRQVGLRGFVTFNLSSIGMIISAIIHPVYLATLVLAISDPLALWGDRSVAAAVILGLDLFNLCAGYVAVAMLAERTLTMRGREAEVAGIVWLPVYWLLMSVAGCRALFQLVSRPHHWEKTPHGRAPSSGGLRPSAAIHRLDRFKRRSA